MLARRSLLAVRHDDSLDDPLHVLGRVQGLRDHSHPEEDHVQDREEQREGGYGREARIRAGGYDEGGKREVPLESFPNTSSAF